MRDIRRKDRGQSRQRTDLTCTDQAAICNLTSVSRANLKWSDPALGPQTTPKRSRNRHTPSRVTVRRVIRVGYRRISSASATLGRRLHESRGYRYSASAVCGYLQIAGKSTESKRERTSAVQRIGSAAIGTAFRQTKSPKKWFRARPLPLGSAQARCQEISPVQIGLSNTPRYASPRLPRGLPV